MWRAWPLNLFLGYREPSEIPVFPGKEHSDLGTESGCFRRRCPSRVIVQSQSLSPSSFPEIKLQEMYVMNTVFVMNTDFIRF